MAELWKDFIEQFHNLPGDTVKRKQQNLFCLFNQQRAPLFGNEEQLRLITANLIPTTHLEKIFRVDYLIYFRRFKELYQEFKNGEEITLCKVAKQDWFFQDAFKSLGTEEFVKDVLPTMPYVVKLKILKKLTLSEEQNDEIFDAIHKRYGLFLATIFLPKCSVTKIRATLTSQLIKLTPSQLKLIHKKDPDLVSVYFEQRTKHEGDSTFMNDNSFLVYLAQNNPELFSKLFEQYNFKTKLGHRTTKRFLHTQKGNVLAKPEPYFDILNHSSLVRKVGYDLKYLFFKKNQKLATPYWQPLLKHFPKKQQFHVYKSVYDAHHHYKFGESIDAISEDILKIIPDPIEREKFAKLKLKKDEKDIYLKYVTTDYCLREFTERLNQMAISERVSFIKIVTECCILNEDLDALLKVCELVAVRFKNDDATIRSDFLCSFFPAESIFVKFTDQHWKLMMDIVATIKAKEEWVWNEYKIRFAYLEYLINNDKPLRPVLLKYSDWIEYMRYDSLRKKWKMNRKIICELIEIDNPNAKDKGEAARHDCELASLCKKFNKEVPEHAINVHSNRRFLKSVKYLLKNDEEIYGLVNDGLQYIISSPESSEEVKELHTLYFQKFKSFGHEKTCCWFLKHEPRIFQKYFDDFLVSFTDAEMVDTKKLWRLMKKYHHLELVKKTVDFCILKLKEEGFDDKVKLVKALSMLSPPDVHLELIKAYVPTSEKVDLTDTETKDLYLVQCELIKYLHLVNAPAAVLTLTLQFCKGDYLKAALGPLYSSIYKLPENQTKEFIEKIDLNKAVSVKKHALNLSCVVYDYATVYNCLKNAQVPSLTPTLKYFGKNSTDFLWELLEQKIAEVDKNELQIFKWIEKISMPLKYKTKYVEAVWTVLDKYENNQIKKVLLKSIDEYVIQQLHPEFAYKFIEKTIFTIEEANDLISRLLIYINDDRKFEILSKLLTQFKENLWKRKETRRTARQKLSIFVKSLFKTYMELKKPIPQFVNDFLNVFDSVFRPTEAFEEFVEISFMKLKNESPEICGKFFVEFANGFLRDYGKSILKILAEIVDVHVLPHLFKVDSDKMKFVYFMFKCKETDDHNLLILYLLPKAVPEDIEGFEMYDVVLTDLEQVADHSVQVLFNLYLKSSNLQEGDAFLE